LPEKRAAGFAKPGVGWTFRWPLGLTALLLALLATPLPAAELEESSPSPDDGLAGAAESTASGGAGVDIRIADLLAGGSVLAGVAPRTDTSGIGADLERDLFATGEPLNAPPSAPPENDPFPSY
jgi:hypothetical protein